MGESWGEEGLAQFTEGCYLTEEKSR
ncbi:unnamed protein product [Linum tenue]|uniref:Uncharacterized protein n=1 Tax=Linum tenue TaxID=586396 RepID=A0AAV0IQ12_9ROSI|nr:unnamed protein product [Linum tenue]